MILPALLALAAPVAAQADYPLIAMLNEARATCSLKAPLAGYKSKLAAKGWKPAVPAAGSWLAGWVAMNQSSDPATKMSDAVLTRTFAGRKLYVYLVEIRQTTEDGPSHFLSCNFYDFSAADGVLTDDVVLWSGKQPVRSPFGSDDGIVLQRWTPGLSPGADDAGVHFIPPGEPIEKKKHGLNYSATFSLPID